MTVTLTLSDILLLIITLAVAGLAVYLVMALRRLGAVLGELQKTLAKVGEVLPRIEKAAEQAERTFGSIETLATGATKAVEDVSAVTAITRALVEQGAEQVSGAMSTLGQIGTILTGIRAGWECFTRRSRGGAEPEEADPVETEEPREE